MDLILGIDYTVVLLTGMVTLLFLFYKLWTQNYGYWMVRGVPCLDPTFPFGNTFDLLLKRKFIGVFFSEMYFKLEGHRYGGFINLRRPQLLLRDPELIKHVMTKDFSVFVDRGTSVDLEAEPILGHLFNLRGNTWRRLRAKLSPTFTSGKLKLMLHMMKGCAGKLAETLEALVSTESDGKEGVIVEMKDCTARYGMDVIGSCAFGLDIGAIHKPDNMFRKYLGEIFKQRFSVMVRNFLNIPGLGRKLGIRNFPEEATNFFFEFIRKTVECRENCSSKAVRNDFLDLLIQIKNKGELAEDELSDFVDNGKEKPINNTPSYGNFKNLVEDLSNETMTAQCFGFFVGGFESSSTTFSFCLHELAINKGIQNKLQEEVDTVLEKHEGEVTYNSLKQMTYMDRVVEETLRKYPPLAVLQRECQEDYKIPGSDTVIEKNMKVFIALYGLHYDPKFYPDPEKFDPERFTEEGKRSRPSYAYLPFGEGPRSCLGRRFAWMQIKVGLTTIMSEYNVEIPPGVDSKLKLDKRVVITAAEGGVRLKITKRN